MAVYNRKVANLSAPLNADTLVREEATAALRSLVDRIVAYPAKQRGRFELELRGQLAAAMNPEKYGNGGGGRGIRTLVTVSRKHAFQACALSHSATPPVPQRALRRCTRSRRSLATATDHGYSTDLSLCRSRDLLLSSRKAMQIPVSYATLRNTA